MSLTAYNTGYFLAQALGEYDSTAKAYTSPDDPDDTITSIRFELYKSAAGMAGADSSELVASQTVTSGYITYFSVSSDSTDPIHTGDYYWLRAYYIYNDGEKEVELPIYESNSSKLGAFASVDSNETTDDSFTAAWDGARLLTITNVSLTFTGDENTRNTTTDTSSNYGITFNSIEGTLTAEIGASNGYVLNEDYPMELQISAEPDYYVSTEYTAVSNTYLYTASAGVTSDADGNTGSIAAVTELNIPLDLTGLKADTTYMFTLYGYDSNYNRVTIGSLSLKTASERTVKIALAVTSNNSGIGVYFRLGEQGATNYYKEYGSSYWTYADYQEEYLQNTNASYRSLYSLTFELYRADDSSTMLGSVTLYDESDPIEVGRNTLYEQFYGANAYYTMQSYAASGYEGIVGVGSKYVYRFVNSAGVELQESSLTNGSYYITVIAAYDYTEYRYDYMDYNSDSGVYDYYAWTSAESAYVNSLPLSGTVKYSNLELVAAPYLEPDEIVSSDGSYITVTELLNSEVGEFNGDDDDDSVYSLFWDDDTVAGLKLTTSYVGDTTYPTQTFTYYGFSYDVWSGLASSTTPTQETDEAGEAIYDIKITITLNALGTESPRTTVPEVYLLFYNEDDLPYIANIDGITPSDSNYIGADFVYDTTGSEDGYLVLFMNEKSFYRGQSYVFAFEAELTEDYEFATQESASDAFQYPEDYYALQGEDYTKSNTLCSNVISIYRQEPVVYSQLVSTTGGEQDVWSIYIDDPDDAIQWKSILDTYNTTSPVSQASDRGGITNLFGEKLGANSEGYYLAFDFVSATDSTDVVALNELYEYYDTSSDETAPSYYLVDEDLEDIRKAVTYLYFDSDDKEVTTRGTTVNVWNLDPEGDSYRLSADYILLDDVGYNAATSYTNISLLEHNYISVMSADDEDDQLDVKDVQPDDDNNTIYVYLSASENDLTEWGTAGELSETDDYYLSADYLNKARQIAAVKLTAEVSDDGGETYTYIYDRNSSGDILDGTKKELWLYPVAPSSGASDYRYYLKFKITDLDSASDSTLQYEIGDLLTFHLEVYYLTGDGGFSDTGDTVKTSEYYAVKYVNAIENASLYGTTTRYYSERYLYTSSRTVNRTYAGAGRSLFYVGASYVTGSTLPWQQTITLSSDTFDTALGTNNRMLSYYLTNLDGYSATDVLEIMEVATYEQTDIGATEVASAVPSLNSTTTTGGLTTVNISVTLENWNMVELASDEEVIHLYYLIYSYTVDNSGTATKGSLVGAWIGSENDLDTSDGTISVDLTGLSGDTSYYIEVFYKDADNAGSSAWTDDDLFSSYDKNTLYTGSGAVDIAQTIWGGTDYLTGTLSDDNLFQYVVNGKKVFGATTEGVTISAVSLSLGNSYSTFTTTKTLKATATISSEILNAEQDSLYVCYKLERYPEDPTSNDEWTVVATDTQMYDGTAWDSAATKYPANTTKGENTLSWTYEAGNGVIKPGYSYRVTADVYQLQSGGNYVSVSSKDDGEDTGAVTSDAVTWSSVSLDDDEQALIQTANITYSDTTISFSYHMNDVNYTSQDNTYYVYLTQKSGDSYTLLNDTTANSTLYSAPTIGTAHQMGSTYSGSFQNLSYSTTYRLQ
ncbi:MAG: hypothetical protein LUE31_09575, partial [Lachnospiraceae bacterium]|nr:hypothetical protein [Lachnospiraceae bacterium]